MAPPARDGSGSASTPAARSPTSSPSTRTPASWSPPRRPSTPAQPGRRVHGRHRQGARPARAAAGDGDAIAAVSHGTTVATNQLLEGKVDRLGLRHHRGLRGDARDRPAVGARRLRQLLLLGEAATGSCRATWSRASAAGSTSPAPRCGPSTRTAPARSPAGSASAGHRHPRRLLPARLRQPRARGADARGARRGAPRRGGVALQRGAARVPRVRAGDDHARRRRRQAAALGVRHQHQGPAGRVRRRPQGAVLRDEVQRRRALAPTRSCTSRSPPCCPARPPARSAPR